ncbi:hypothetical protein [Rubricoccus marinus]|uniref:Uncharacterized protein n=1 Tax=Rubricoccus marinus TaxID=716817 RepID=A0A259TV70_9BACT|nr:hypothetical protein [Rubricoccus marinus]OZC01662.1 hypothetical protein BSZ36_00900 [Rubricoccus marinus]
MRPIAFLLSFLGAAAVAQPVAVPGTRASLTPPEGFAPSERFAGFESGSLGASIMVVEIPEAPLEEIMAAFTPEALATQNITAAARREVGIGGVTSVLVTGQQQAYGETFDKWILATGDSLGVVMVTAALPQGASGEAQQEIERAVLSLTIGAAPEDLFEGLPFRLDAPEALPVRKRIGASLLLAQGYGEAQPAGAPFYIAALGAAPLGDDIAGAAVQRLRQTPTVRDIGPVETRELEVGGMPGVEAIAQAVDADSGEPVMVVLVLVPTVENGYLIIQAMVGAEAWEEWGPRFRAVTDSLVWTP